MQSVFGWLSSDGSGLLQHVLNRCPDLPHFRPWVYVLHAIETAADDKLCEVPGDDSSPVCTLVMQTAVTAEEPPHFICVLSVDITLGKHWEVCIVTLPCELFDF